MEETEEIDLRDLFEIIWKKRTMIIIGTLMFMLMGTIFSFATHKYEYETFTTLRIKMLEEDVNSGDYDAQLNALAITDRIVNTYGEIARSKTVANEVIKNLDLDMTYTQFTDNIEVSLIDGTEIIKINVKGDNAQEVANIANETSKAFLNNISNYIRTENMKDIQIIDQADVPKEPISGGKLLNIAIATILGFMVSIFVVFLLNYLDKSVRKTEELEHILGLSVLGEINKNDIDSVEAYNKLRTNLEYGFLNEGDNVISVASTISDEGKTDIVVNLGKSIARLGKRVLVLDCNLKNPQLHNALKLESISIGLNQLLSKGMDYTDCVISTDIDRLDFIGSSGDELNSSELIDSSRMKDLMENVKKDYDFVILDTPEIKNSSDALVVSAMADGVVFVSELGNASRDDIVKAKEDLVKVKANILGLVVSGRQ